MSDSELDAVNASDSATALEVIFGRGQDGIIVGGSRREKQRRAKYWRKPEHEGATDSGWIVAGPDYKTDPSRHERLKDRGWKELPDSFGLQITGQGDNAKNPTTISWEASARQRQRPTIWLEPLIANGGLTYKIKPTEDLGTPGTYIFTAEQIVAYGLHRRPGIAQLRPDLAEAVDLECPHACINNNKTRRLFSGVNREEAQKSLDQHMSSEHRMSEGARAVGFEVSRQVEAVGAGNKIDPEAIAAITAAIIPAVLKAVGVEVKEPKAPEPEKVAGPRYPEGEPAPDWKRQELMAWAKDNGYQIPENRMQMSRDDWYNYIVNPVAPEPEEEEYAELVEA